MISFDVQNFLNRIPLETQNNITLQTSMYNLIEYVPGTSTYAFNEKWFYGIVEQSYVDTSEVRVSYGTSVDRFYKKNCLDVELVNLAVELSNRIYELANTDGVMDIRVKNVLVDKIPDWDGSWAHYWEMIVGGLIPNMNSILNELVGLTPLAASPDEQILLMCVATEISSILFLMPGYSGTLYDSVIAWLNYYIIDINTINDDVGNYLSNLWNSGDYGPFPTAKAVIDDYRDAVPLEEAVYNQPPIYNVTIYYNGAHYQISEWLYSETVGWVYRFGERYATESTLVLNSEYLPSDTFARDSAISWYFPRNTTSSIVYMFKNHNEYNHMPVVEIADANDYKFKAPQSLPVSVNTGGYKIGYASWGSYHVFGRVSKGEADFTIVGIYSIADVPVLYDIDKTNSQLSWSFELFDSQKGTIKDVTDITTYTRIKTSIFMFELGDIVSCENQDFTNGIVYSRSLQDLGQYALRSYAIAYGGNTWWVPELLLRKEGHNKQFLTQISSVGWWDSVGQWLGFKSETDYNEITKELYSVQAALVKKDEQKTNVDRLLSQKGYELDNNIALAGAATVFLLLLFFVD